MDRLDSTRAFWNIIHRIHSEHVNSRLVAYRRFVLLIPYRAACFVAMTISYSDNYFKILARWRGSAWKAVWKELLLWLLIFYVIKLVLEFCVPPYLDKDAHKIVALFRTYTEKVPLHFLLGFYVGQVLTRWWNQIQQVPWPDDIMSWVCAILPGDDKDSKLRRHLVARYLTLSETLVLRAVSTRVRKRFPTVELLVSAGLMTEEELKLYNACPCPNNGWQLPLQWAINGVLVPLNRRNEDPIALSTMGHMMNAFNAFRANLRQLFMYDWICIPLVYTQTVSVVVYGYFAMCLIGHQSFGNDADIYVPVLTTLQFIFYVGWFKVAQDLMRPFGEDDDDIELNYLLDRHVAVALNLANYVTTNYPPLREDRYFQEIEKNGDKSECLHLAYTNISLLHSRDRPPKLHAAVRVAVPDADLIMSYKPYPVCTTMDATNRGPLQSTSAESESSHVSISTILKSGAQKFRGENSKKEQLFF